MPGNHGKLAAALVPKKMRASTMPATEYEFTPNSNRVASKSAYGTGYGTTTAPTPAPRPKPTTRRV